MALHTFITQSQPNLGRVFFGNAPPVAADGNTYVIGDFIQFTPTPQGTAITQAGIPAGWYCTLGGAGGTATWVPVGQGGGAYVTDSGANNAIVTAAGTGPALYTGLTVAVLLAHSLQAGANTFAYNGGAAVAIKSARNPANDIATAYVSTGVVTLRYNGTIWLDTSQ